MCPAIIDAVGALIPLCPAPLCGMARWNRPLARGIASRVPTDMPPADSPAIVTLAGSPPNAAMFCCTHSRAAIWSSMPRLPDSASSGK